MKVLYDYRRKYKHFLRKNRSNYFIPQERGDCIVLSGIIIEPEITGWNQADILKKIFEGLKADYCVISKIKNA